MRLWQRGRLANALRRAVAALRAGMAEGRRRLRMVHRAPGARFLVPFNDPPAFDPCCCSCGAPATRSLAPARSLLVAFGPLPALELPACDACAAAMRAHKRFEWGAAAGAASFALAACVVSLALLPWAPWPFAPLAAVLGASLAPLLRLVRAPVALGSIPWRAAAARWVSRTPEGAVLESPSDLLSWSLRAAAPVPQPATVVEREGALALLVAAAMTFVVAPVFWVHTHPRVRILNVGIDSVEVSIDGRSLGPLPPVWTEVPNAGIERRVPVGWRLFVTRNDAGEIVDRTRAWVPTDAPAVYAPRPAPHCLWIEQRAYGASQQPLPAKLPLGTATPFHVLPLRVDAWFQPNPVPASDGRLFSGGIRRALRFGSCPDVSSP